MNGEPVLPALWREAFQRDAEGPPPAVADPLPERRLARVLAAYIASGLLFMLAPGTLVGVWNLVGISSHRQANLFATDGQRSDAIRLHGRHQAEGKVDKGTPASAAPVGKNILSMTPEEWTAFNASRVRR